jgi:fructose-1,6-bisphosphatase I
MYSANEANSYAWDGRIQDYVDDLKIGKTPSGVVYDYRYNGALIADIHNILHHGGYVVYCLHVYCSLVLGFYWVVFFE